MGNYDSEACDFCGVENPRRHSSRKALDHAELLNTGFFLQGKEVTPFHPEDRSGCCLTTW